MRAPSRAGRIYTMEPASFSYDENGTITGRLIANPGIYHPRPPIRPGYYRIWGAPRCTSCGAVMAWTGPPRRVGRLWIYKMRGHEGSGCRCAPYDFARSPFRLVVGGTNAWWRSIGWALRGVG